MSKNDTGVILRREPKVYNCGYCGDEIILGETEVANRLYVKSGLPICPTCRILKSHAGGRIRADRDKAKQDKGKAKEFETNKENERVKKIGASQKDAGL